MKSLDLFPRKKTPFLQIICKMAIEEVQSTQHKRLGHLSCFNNNCCPISTMSGSILVLRTYVWWGKYNVVWIPRGCLCFGSAGLKGFLYYVDIFCIYLQTIDWYCSGGKDVRNHSNFMIWFKIVVNVKLNVEIRIPTNYLGK